MRGRRRVFDDYLRPGPPSLDPPPEDIWPRNVRVELGAVGGTTPSGKIQRTTSLSCFCFSPKQLAIVNHRSINFPLDDEYPPYLYVVVVEIDGYDLLLASAFCRRWLPFPRAVRKLRDNTFRLCSSFSLDDGGERPLPLLHLGMRTLRYTK